MSCRFISVILPISINLPRYDSSVCLTPTAVQRTTSVTSGCTSEERRRRAAPTSFYTTRGDTTPTLSPSPQSPPRSNQRDRQQHDEISIVLALQAALHRQPPVYVGVIGEAGGQPAERRLRQPRAPHRPQRPAETEGDLPVRPL